MKKRVLNIQYASDDNYAHITGVSICSLLENNRQLEEINIFYVSDNVNEINKKKLLDIIARYDNAKLIFIDGTEFLYRLKDVYRVTPHKGTYSTYFKLLAANYIKTDNDRLIQLDGDTIVVGSLEELCNLNLDGKMLGATYDCQINSYKKLIGKKPTDKYYNCGLVYFDQKRWRENNAEDILINHLRSQRSGYYLVDQDLLNVNFGNEFTHIPLKFNINPSFELYGIKQTLKLYDLKPEYYDIEETIHLELLEPRIYHAMGAQSGRPWESDSVHPWNGLFEKYLQKTPFLDTPKIVVKRPTIYKIQRWMWRHLPQTWYIPVHRVVYYMYMRNVNKKAIAY